MAVLLVGVNGELSAALVDRLVKEGDEVRLLTRDDALAAEMKVRGAHIASGPAWDADLIERAAQNVRTIVVGEAHGEDPAGLVDAIVTGGGLAAPDMRVVLVGGSHGPAEQEILRASPLDYVTLAVPPARRWWGRGERATAPEDVAEAVDAADDLAGNPRLELDLSDPEDWSKLALDPP